MNYVNCKLCPRECGADRNLAKFGACRCPDIALVAKTMLHKWEEPALAGNGGSGAIFFGGCTLGCAFCQNRAISGKPCGALCSWWFLLYVGGVVYSFQIYASAR